MYVCMYGLMLLYRGKNHLSGTGCASAIHWSTASTAAICWSKHSRANGWGVCAGSTAVPLTKKACHMSFSLSPRTWLYVTPTPIISQGISRIWTGSRRIFNTWSVRSICTLFCYKTMWAFSFWRAATGAACSSTRSLRKSNSCAQSFRLTDRRPVSPLLRTSSACLVATTLWRGNTLPYSVAWWSWPIQWKCGTCCKRTSSRCSHTHPQTNSNK